MSDSVSRIQIRDEGELAEVRVLLDGLHVTYSEADPGDALPTHLVISSGPCAVETQKEVRRAENGRRPIHLVIIDRASRSLRAMLERHGCDIVVRRPVHPTALRLVVQRAVYLGAEQREMPRVAIGGLVKVKSGLFSRTATLAELSLRGCGLLTSHTLELQSELLVTIPKLLTGTTPLTLSGRVVGTQRAIEVEKGKHACAVVFTGLKKADLKVIKGIMKSCAVGDTGQLSRPPDATPTPPAPTEAAAAPDASNDEKTGAERRTTPRGHYTQNLLARGSNTTHPLMGRDLSIGGMRVAPEPTLKVGMKLRLAVYGDAGIAPVIVTASVVRDDGGDGLGLKFEPLASAVEERLHQIVDELAELDSEDGPNTVVGELLGAS